MTLLELAERCEKATGPDRELDIRICTDGLNKSRLDDGFQTAPHFTASLDAAMTLANDLGGEVTFFRDGTAKAYLWQPYPLAIEAKAATPALALCAAALRARGEEEKAR